LHESSTPGFLIARHETTFCEWIEFLRSLPSDERKARLPRVTTGGFQGTVSLQERTASAWELALMPTTVVYRARSGEPLVYEGRKTRASVAWERMPVVGISADDAASYTAWLNRTGRLPHARLCTDEEWERAARGADAREYPHGGNLAPDDANFDETYAKLPVAMGPDGVGSHPESSSPFGVQDMAGNVWEWVAALGPKGGHAARGGSYYFDVNSARVSNRETPEPSFRDASVGMRVCADLPGPTATLSAALTR